MSAVIRSGRAWLGLLLCAATASGAAPARAQLHDEVPAPRPANLPAEEDTHRLVVLPVLDLTGTSPELARLSTGLLTEGFARYPRLEVIAGPELISRLRTVESYRKDLSEARELAQMGQRQYEQIRLKEAIKLLTMAVQKYGSIHYELEAPREVATTLLTLAKAYLEYGEDPQSAMKAELTFQQLLLADPSVRLLPERFSETVINLFTRARYWATYDRLPGLRTDKALAVAARVRADYVLSGALLPRAEAGHLLLAVQLLDVRRKMPLASEQVGISESPERLELRLDRLSSRMAACIPNDVWLARQRNPKRFDPTLSFDTSYLHLVFLQHPLQRTFNNMGLGTGVSWALLEHLSLLARLSFTTSRNNYPHEDLLDPANLLRLVLGAGIAHHGERLSVFSVTGFDLLYPFRFRWTREADCKWHEVPPDSCYDSSRGIHTHDPGLVFGLHVGAGANWAFAPPLLLHFRTGLSYYFLPTTGNELNLPVEAELGIGYRF